MAFCPQKIDQIGRRNVVLFQSRVGRGPPTVRIDEDIGWAECKRHRFRHDVLDLFVRVYHTVRSDWYCNVVGHNGIWLSRILIGVRPFHLYAIMRIDETGRHRGINQWVLIKPLVHMDSWEKLNHL